jgi:DNA polymerase-1
MRTIGIDTEYDYCSPFLATTTDDELVSRVYRLNIISQRKQIKAICENPNLIKVFHHSSGDIFQFRCIGIKVAWPIEDTLIQSNLVDENYSSRNLKELAKHHLGEEIRESNLLRSKIKQYKAKAKKGGYAFKWSQIPEEVIIPYAKRDPEYTIKLHYYWKTPMKEYEKLYAFEKSIVPLIVDMEWKGVGIDRYLCGRKAREYGREMESLYESMAKFIVDKKIDLSKKFKPRSPQQIQKIILALGLENDVDQNEKTGVPKTDKKQLVKLYQHYDFFKMVQQFRFFGKHKGTYYGPLEEYYTSEKSNRAHFMIYQTGAKTGRFSVELAQTFPRPEDSILAGQKHEVRRAIIPAKGKAFLCKDYEQQEMRLFIHYSNCERMIDLINKKGGGRGLDIYIETGYLLFGKMFDDPKLRKPLRYITKRDALSGIYGVGVPKLIDSTTVECLERFDKELIDKIGISPQWAYDVLQKFNSIYPVREYTSRKMSELYKQGFITLEFNSRLMNFTRQYRIPQDKAYKGPNAEIQGTAAYIIKHAMKRVDNRLQREGWKGKRVDLLLQVHDELVFEVDDDPVFIKHVDQVLTEEMEDWDTFKVPITCSAKWSNKSWGDVVDLK